MMDQIRAAGAEYAKAVDQGSSGRIKPTLQVDEDQEIVVLNGRPPAEIDGGASLASFGPSKGTPLEELVGMAVGPRINADRFQSLDGVFRGPYRQVFVVHAGLSGPRGSCSIDGMPVTVIPWFAFTRQLAQAALAEEMTAVTGSREGLSIPRPRLEEPPGIPSAFGDMETAQEGDAWKLTSTGVVGRGGAWVGRVKGLAAGSVIKFRAKSTAKDRFALNISRADGSAIASIQLAGISRAVNGLMAVLGPDGAQVLAGPEWTEFSIPVADIPGIDQAAWLDIGSPAATGPLEKPAIERSVIEFTLPEVSVGEAAQKVGPVPPNPVQTTLAAIAAKAGAGLTSEDVMQLGEVISSAAPAEKAAALAVAGSFAPAKDARVLGLLEPGLRSALPLDAILSARAVAAHDMPEGWALLEQVIQKGPFETNRRFAAEALRGRTGNGLESKMNMLLIQRGWRARLAGVEALAAMGGRDVDIIFSATLQQEPHAAVRLRMIQQLDPGFDLSARRMLYAGVNDPSQWVRAAALASLLGSSIETIRSEALKGVSDDAPGVRLHLLGLMMAKPDPAYRSALRQAVADPDARVRAAALDGLGALADAVQLAEIQNTLEDPSEPVQLALVRLARSRKVSLPAEAVARLRNSTYASVRDQAATAFGSKS